MKKIICGVISGLMLVSLSSCSGGSDTVSVEEYNSVVAERDEYMEKYNSLLAEYETFLADPDSSESTSSESSSVSTDYTLLPVEEYDLPINVFLSPSATYHSGTVVFTISTNLPDQSDLMLTLRGKTGTFQGHAIVKNGVAESDSFGASSASSMIFADVPYQFTVSLSAARFQSEYVQSVIGSNGENLSGPLVDSSDTRFGNVVILSYNVVFSSDGAVSFDGSSEPVSSQPYDVTEVDSSSHAEESTEEAPLTESQSSDSPTTGQRSALSKAKDYLKYAPFSYSGLVDQLVFDGFSEEEATYGADNCGADWMAQASRKASDYMNYTSFSKNGLIDQLEFDGFTHEQAVYGANAVFDS